MRSSAYALQRVGAGWLTQQVPPVTLNLPADVYAELAERAAHDGIALDERLTWLVTELVRGNR